MQAALSLIAGAARPCTKPAACWHRSPVVVPCLWPDSSCAAPLPVWRPCRAAQEPQNAHSHLLSIVLGNSETVPITQGQLALGTWQVGGAGSCVVPLRLPRALWFNCPLL